jgi:hypothetical protein
VVADVDLVTDTADAVEDRPAASNALAVTLCVAYESFLGTDQV